MSGGSLIGECLAKHGGIRCLTRENLLATINTFGGLASRVAERVNRAAEAYEEFSELRRPYRILMKKALLQYAREGHLVYLGYSGHLLVERVPHFVRVRMIASTQLRIAMTQRRLGYSEKEACDYIRQVDQDRSRWARWMYGLDIRDPLLYDVSLNLDRMSMEAACRLLRTIMQEENFQPTPAAIAQVEDDYLATQALASLATDPRTAQLEISATASGGVLRLIGPYLPESELSVVRSVALSDSGAARIEYEPGYAPPLF